MNSCSHAAKNLAEICECWLSGPINMNVSFLPMWICVEIVFHPTLFSTAIYVISSEIGDGYSIFN